MKAIPILILLSALTAGLEGQQAQGGVTAKDLRRMAAALQRDPMAHVQQVARASWTAPSDRVRAAAAELLVRRKLHGAAVEHVAPGLRDPDPEVRARAAEALARLGYPQAGRLLGTSSAGETAGKSPRSHVAFLEQRAVLRDFDVEVA